MPTATEFFGITAQNHGALTTTYTAPSSCATNINDPWLVNATSPYRLLGRPLCSTESYGDCRPTGEGGTSGDQQTSTFFQSSYGYYSPGIACPAGWKTVGLLAHTESGKFSASGMMTTPAPTLEGHPRHVYSTDFWKNIMDVSETLAYCCPSGFEHTEIGGCMSSLGPVTSYTYSEFCVLGRGSIEWSIISSVDDLNYPDGVASRVEPTETPMYDTSMMDFEEAMGGTEGISDMAVATWAPGIYLVYKESDMVEGKGNSNGEGDNDGEGPDENVATPIAGQGVISVLGITLGLLAGTGMIFT